MPRKGPVPRSFREIRSILLERIASFASNPSVGCGATERICALPASRTNKRPSSELKVIPWGSFIPKARIAERSRAAEGSGKPFVSDLISAISPLPWSSTKRLPLLGSKAALMALSFASRRTRVPVFFSPVVIRVPVPLVSRTTNVFVGEENAMPPGSATPNSLVYRVRTTQAGADGFWAETHVCTGMTERRTSPVRIIKRQAIRPDLRRCDILLLSFIGR